MQMEACFYRSSLRLDRIVSSRAICKYSDQISISFYLLRQTLTTVAIQTEPYKYAEGQTDVFSLWEQPLLTHQNMTQCVKELWESCSFGKIGIKAVLVISR